MRIVVIIPTYNEAESIESLIDAAESELNEIRHHEFKILVVDANSPDKTGEIVENLQKKHKNLELLIEPAKRGLGAAYISGMLHAINNLSADALMEFDGDFQHNPKEIKSLISAFDDGYDYVIGSRYVEGGEIPGQWAWHRKFLSKYGSLFIKSVLGLATMDNTSGFKLSRVKHFAKKLPLEERVILSLFHAYKIHLLYEMIKLGAKTIEVPIKFLERQQGSSKNTFRDILESLKVVLILKFRSLFRY
jgi:dolichol-phosphate mannosyltransferase